MQNINFLFFFTIKTAKPKFNINFKKLTNQFLAGVFGLALMGGVMLSFNTAYTQEAFKCSSGDEVVCFLIFDTQTGTKYRVFGGKGNPNPQISQPQ